MRWLSHWGYTSIDVLLILERLMEELDMGDGHSDANTKRPLGLNFDDPVVTNKKGGKQTGVGFRLDLLDSHAILRLGAVLKEGADKGYEKNNWMLISADEHINHALGHIMAYLGGDHYEDEEEDHLGHAFCRLMFALRMEDLEMRGEE